MGELRHISYKVWPSHRSFFFQIYFCCKLFASDDCRTLNFLEKYHIEGRENLEGLTELHKLLYISFKNLLSSAAILEPKRSLRSKRCGPHFFRVSVFYSLGSQVYLIKNESKIYKYYGKVFSSKFIINWMTICLKAVSKSLNWYLLHKNWFFTLSFHKNLTKN